MAIEIAGKRVPSNSASWVELEVTQDADMSPIAVQMYVLNGAGDGPTVWLQGNIHGNEHEGGLAFRDFLLDLDPSEVDGAFVGVPAANPSAFANKARVSPIGIDQFGTADVNRAFPGETGGPFPKAMAHSLFEAANEHADYFVGTHSADGEGRMDPGFTVVSRTGDDVYDESLAMAEVVDIPHIVEFEPGGVGGSMYEKLAGAGTPAILIECGGGATINDYAMETFTKGARNVARQVGVLDGDPVLENDPETHDGLTFIYTSVGGFFHSDVELDDVVDEGTEIGRVTNLRGETVDTFEARYEGIIISVRTYPIARPGDKVFSMAPLPGEEGFSNVE